MSRLQSISLSLSPPPPPPRVPHGEYVRAEHACWVSGCKSECSEADGIIIHGPASGLQGVLSTGLQSHDCVASVTKQPLTLLAAVAAAR